MVDAIGRTIESDKLLNDTGEKFRDDELNLKALSAIVNADEPDVSQLPDEFRFEHPENNVSMLEWFVKNTAPEVYADVMEIQSAN